MERTFEMHKRLADLPRAHTDFDTMIASCLCIGILAYLILSLFKRKAELRKLSHIPSVTTELPLLSYCGAIRFVVDGSDLLQRGYSKYKGGAFKVPSFFRWHVFVTGKSFVEDLRKARESELSLRQMIDDFVYIEHNFGPEILDNSYHVQILRAYLARNIHSLYPDIHEELVTGIRELIPLSDEWISVPASKTVLQIICGTSNRVFVGLPLCRNAKFNKLQADFVIQMVKASFLIGAVPKFLRGFVARLTPVQRYRRLVESFMAPVIEELTNFSDEYGGDLPDESGGMLLQLIRAVPKVEPIIPSVALRVSMINFAAVHTTSMMFLHVLFQVLSKPEYHSELRREVDQVVAEYGWGVEALTRMVKVDSFVKETGRCIGVMSESILRTAMVDFTFSDGTVIPKGTAVSIPSRATHLDDQYYQNAQIFDPWRFCASNGGSESLGNPFTNTSPEMLTFGYGKHVCPGRFLASVQIKIFLAHLVYHYDMKLKNEGSVPPASHIMTTVVPNQRAEVMFKKRREHVA